jgi:HEAT repeat protein
MEAALELASMSSTEKDVVSALVEALGGASYTQREMAALVLSFLRPPAKAAVPALVNALHDKHRGLRRRAAAGLGRMRAEAGAAIPDLVTAMRDIDTGVQRAAALALQEISCALTGPNALEMTNTGSTFGTSASRDAEMIQAPTAPAGDASGHSASSIRKKPIRS